ncbi:MAG: peptidoglycan editing factor PgeF [Thermodesulfobacteriota bacterium]
MRLHRKNNLLFFTFASLKPFSGLVHGCFTRVGGYSRGGCARLNVGFNTGDDDAAVRQNRAAIAECVDGELVFVNQVHQSDVVIIDDDPDGAASPAAPQRADTMITRRSRCCLAIQVADCQAVMLYDPKHRVIANVHAGWRGSVANIIGGCIETMKRRFQTRPENIVAGIGPSLGPCCAEFVHYRTEMPESLWPYKDSRDRFNFWQISHDQLIAAGVPEKQIEWAGMCTKCNPHLFFSYRRDKSTGRLAAVIGLQ